MSRILALLAIIVGLTTVGCDSGSRAEIVKLKAELEAERTLAKKNQEAATEEASAARNLLEKSEMERKQIQELYEKERQISVEQKQIAEVHKRQAEEALKQALLERDKSLQAAAQATEALNAANKAKTVEK